MPHSHRPSFRGHCAMCAEATGKVRGLGDARRMPVTDLRRFGRSTRVSRHDIPEDQWPSTRDQEDSKP